MKERRFRTVTANIVIFVVLGAVLATTVAALREDFNELLSKLKAAGLMATDTTE